MEAEGLDIFQILLQSGFVVKFVLIVLIGCSIFSWAIILQKRKVINEIVFSNARFYEFFKGSTNLVEIYDQTHIFKESTLSTMFRHGYDELSKIREKLKSVGKESELRDYIHAHGVTALERSLKHGANESGEILDSRLTQLATIGSVSPFIGLFGTVWGIINSFSGLASGGGSIEAVAPGIAEALVATAVGLAAAIPAVWAYNILTTRISSLNIQMENFGQEFLNLIERSVLISKDN